MSDTNTIEQQTTQPEPTQQQSSVPDYMKPPGLDGDGLADLSDVFNQYMGAGSVETPQKAIDPVEALKGEPEQVDKPKQESPKEEAPIESEEPQGLFDQLLKKNEAKEETGNDSIVEQIKAPENLSEASLEGWNALKSKAKDFEKENYELKQKLTEYEGNPEQVSQFQSQLEELKREKQELLNKIAQKDLTEHPEFQQKYQEPLDRSLSRLESVLEDSRADVKVSDLLKMNKRDLADTVEEITEGMPKVFARDFVEEVAKARELSSAREDALGNASQFISGIEEQSKTQAFQDFNKTVGDFKNEYGMIFQPLKATGNLSEEQKHELSTYNNALAEIETKAQSFAFGKMDNSQMSKVAMQAAANEFMVNHAIPRLEKEYVSLLDANRQMSEQLKSLQGLKPKVAQTTTSDPGKPQFNSTEDLVKHYLGR
jgi:hypothetical protein